MKMISAIFLASVFVSFSQTLKTNQIVAASNFREINGKLYNVQKSILWKMIDVEPSEIQGSVCGAYFLKARGRMVGGDSLSESGNFLGGGGARVVFDGLDYDHQICITNFPKSIVIGMKTKVMAMKVGTTRTGYELWDCGMPHVVSVITTNNISIQAKKN